MSGLEALAQIKKFDQSIKVIMLTVRDDDSTRQEARRLGADEFVTKPFMSDYLEELVSKEVGRLIGVKDAAKDISCG
jgi:DNA-binding response OmpR family regulator